MEKGSKQRNIMCVSMTKIVATTMLVSMPCASSLLTNPSTPSTRLVSSSPPFINRNIALTYTQSTISPQRMVMTDIDTLMKDHATSGSFSNFTTISAVIESPRIKKKRISPSTQSSQPRKPKVNIVRAVPKIKSSIKSNSISKNRSSTMPGLSYKNTARRKKYEDGIDIAEQKSGRNIRSNQAVKARRKSEPKINSEQMYGASASVPNSLIQFVDEIHKERRITPQEEIELGCKTQEGLRLQHLYEDLEIHLKREPTDKEYCAAAGKINMEALSQAINEGVEAKNRLVTSNLRMVQRVVNLYLRNGLGSEYNAGDLMQDGTMALIRAAEKFDPQRGFRFSTYAMYWIRSSVKRSQILQSRVIDVPQRMHENYKKIQKAIKEYENTYGQKPQLSEIAEMVNLSETKVERCIKALEQRIYSLDAEITNPLKAGVMKGSREQKETMYNLIYSKFDNGEISEVERKLIKEDLIRSLRRHLKPKEVDLLLLRYGLIDEKTVPHGFSGPLTIREVSILVGMKPDKVRRMLNNSLRQLKLVIGKEWGNGMNL